MYAANVCLVGIQAVARLGQGCLAYSGVSGLVVVGARMVSQRAPHGVWAYGLISTVHFSVLNKPLTPNDPLAHLRGSTAYPSASVRPPTVYDDRHRCSRPARISTRLPESESGKQERIVS